MGPMCLLSPPTPLPTPRVLTDSAQRATLASGQVRFLAQGRVSTLKSTDGRFQDTTYLFIGDRKRETQTSGGLGLSPLRILLMLRTRHGSMWTVWGLRWLCQSLGVEETEALGDSHCKARRGGYRVTVGNRSLGPV